MEKIYSCLHRPAGHKRMEFTYFYNPEDKFVYIQQDRQKPEKSFSGKFWRETLGKKNYDKIHEASRHILDYLNAKLGAK